MGTYYCVSAPGECNGQCAICPVGEKKTMEIGDRFRCFGTVEGIPEQYEGEPCTVVFVDTLNNTHEVMFDFAKGGDEAGPWYAGAECLRPFTPCYEPGADTVQPVMSEAELDAAWAKEEIRMGLVPDTVNHPPHYTSGSVEVYDFIKAWKLSFAEGNVVKYTVRAPYKENQLEDLKKARWYLDQLIKEAEDADQV